MSRKTYSKVNLSQQKCEKPIKDMKYIPISNASYQLHIHIIFNKINCAIFQKIVKMHEKM